METTFEDLPVEIIELILEMFDLKTLNSFIQINKTYNVIYRLAVFFLRNKFHYISDELYVNSLGIVQNVTKERCDINDYSRTDFAKIEHDGKQDFYLTKNGDFFVSYEDWTAGRIHQKISENVSDFIHASNIDCYITNEGNIYFGDDDEDDSFMDYNYIRSDFYEEKFPNAYLKSISSCTFFIFCNGEVFTNDGIGYVMGNEMNGGNLYKINFPKPLKDICIIRHHLMKKKYIFYITTNNEVYYDNNIILKNVKKSITIDFSVYFLTYSNQLYKYQSDKLVKVINGIIDITNKRMLAVNGNDIPIGIV